MARAPQNGYMVYPSGRQFFSLAQAKKAAKQDSKEFGRARVENNDTLKVVYRESKNPSLPSTWRGIKNAAIRVFKGKVQVKFDGPRLPYDVGGYKPTRGQRS
jgi:hypothetical protein